MVCVTDDLKATAQALQEKMNSLKPVFDRQAFGYEPKKREECQKRLDPGF